MHPLLATALYLYGAVWPGWALAGLVPGAHEDNGGLVRVSHAALIALFGMPLLHYSAAVAFRTNLGPGLVSGVGTAVLALCWIIRRRRRAP